MNRTITLARTDGDPFQSAVDALINAKGSKNTRDAYRADFRRWAEFCNVFGIPPMAPTLEATTAFREHLKASMMPASAQRVLAALSHIYGVMFARGGARGNPFNPKVLDWPVVPNIGKTPAVAAEIAEVMIRNAEQDPNRPRGLRDAAILHLLYDRGLRRSSVGSIARRSLRVIDGRLFASVFIKGGRQVDVDLPESTAQAVRAWLTVAPESPHLFPGRSGRSINLTTINKLVTTRAAQVGAEGVSPHWFRAAFITSAYDLGLNEREIQAAAHHEDSKTTRRYDRGARGERVADAIAELRGKR